MYSEDSTTTEDIHRTQTQLIYDAKEFEERLSIERKKDKKKSIPQHRTTTPQRTQVSTTETQRVQKL
jgi:hypothetical protein